MVFGIRKRGPHQPGAIISGPSLKIEINLLLFKPFYFQDISMKFAYSLPESIHRDHMISTTVILNMPLALPKHFF